MTNGMVVVLGRTGRNFAAGMSGGIAYVYDATGEFVRVKCNRAGVDLEPLFEREDIARLEALLRKHVEYTGSAAARRILDNWASSLPHFVKVFPHEYKRVLGVKRPALQDVAHGMPVPAHAAAVGERAR
jgi:glutamate synthase domain-containing protein 3